MIKYIIAVTLFFFLSKPILSIGTNENLDSLKAIMWQAEKEPDFAKKQKLVEEFNILFEQTLKAPNSFQYNFDSVPCLGVLTSKDSMVKVFTWAVPTGTNGNYLYYGTIQCRHKNKAGSDVFQLEDSKKQLFVPEKEVLEYPNWFGCIYYELIEKYDMGKKVYTLIGYDFNNNMSRKKCIDVLTFNKKGLPVFGSPIFYNGGDEFNSRVIFEYSSQSVMLARYFPDKDKIIFNYLFSIFPDKQDDRKYYIPDISYDGYEFKFGKWMLVKNVPMVKKD